MLKSDNGRLMLPVKQEYLAFAMLMITALMVRINYLGADPPLDLSVSQGAFTDPAQYVSYARNYILWGSFNPLHDFRLVLFLKSMTTVIALVVFKLFGVGYWQANMVGLIFSFSTIVVAYFAVRKIAGNIAALFFLVFISLDYNQIFYGRLPFLENSLNFFAILSFTIMLYARRVYAFVLGGLFLGIGIFFGKVIGLIYLGAFVCYGVYEYFFAYRDRTKEFMIRYGAFVGGFLIILIAWYFISYRPLTSSVEGYLEEQAFNLYGAPEAFDDFNTFVYKYVSFGAKSRLFKRIAIPGLLAMCMMLVFFYRAGFKKSYKNGFFGIKAGTVFLIAHVIGTYGALMIWNYRPLRYQTMLIYSLCALAAIFIKTILARRPDNLDPRGNLSFPFFFFVIILIPIYQLMSPIYNFYDLPYHFLETRSVLLVVAVLLTIGVTAVMRYAPIKFSHPPFGVKAAVIVAAMLLVLIPNANRYLNWNSRATFNTVANSKDLASILSPEAVVTGPYAAVYTLNNNIRNLIHMFGVASVDSTFFRRYPITHLILDQSNETRAKEDYPQIMEKAVNIGKYNVGGREMIVYRVAHFTGNPDAGKYVLSPYETSLYYFTVEKDNKQGFLYMQICLNQNPQCMTPNLAYAKIAKNNGAYSDAEKFYRRAVDFSPTDFSLRFQLGEFYIEMYNKTGNEDFRERARAEFDLAYKYNFGSRKLKAKIAKLLSSEGNPAGE